MTIQNDSKLPQDLTELQHHITLLEVAASEISKKFLENEARLEAARMALLVAENLASTPAALRESLQEKIDINALSSADEASCVADALIHEARMAPTELQPVYAEYIGALAIRFHLHTHDSEDDTQDYDEDNEPERFQC